ncbi:MAG TPA: CBS domain-containing protein [Nitrosopumilaceae archaeon]|nr:CBS domain-containing protein [Nitrosopumilaceae archaeon]
MAHTFVKDVMKKDLITLDSTKSIKEAASLMSDKDVGCVIVTRQNAPVGIITERDFVKRIAAEEKQLTEPVENVMSSPLIAVKPDDTVWDAAETMKTKNIHKVAVQDGNNIVGIVTATDLVKICSLGSDSEMRRICDQILLRMQKNS